MVIVMIVDMVMVMVVMVVAVVYFHPGSPTQLAPCLSLALCLGDRGLDQERIVQRAALTRSVPPFASDRHPHWRWGQGRWARGDWRWHWGGWRWARGVGTGVRRWHLRWHQGRRRRRWRWGCRWSWCGRWRSRWRWRWRLAAAFACALHAGAGTRSVVGGQTFARRGTRGVAGTRGGLQAPRTTDAYVHEEHRYTIVEPKRLRMVMMVVVMVMVMATLMMMMIRWLATADGNRTSNKRRTPREENPWPSAMLVLSPPLSILCMCL